MKDNCLDNRCDVCGRFISFADFENCKASRKLIMPDSDLSSEEYETLCKDHYKPTSDESLSCSICESCGEICCCSPDKCHKIKDLYCNYNLYRYEHLLNENYTLRERILKLEKTIINLHKKLSKDT